MMLLDLASNRPGDRRWDTFRFSTGALYTTSVAPFDATLSQWMYNSYGFTPAMTSFAWSQIFCLGVFFRLFAWLALVYKEIK